MRKLCKRNYACFPSPPPPPPPPPAPPPLLLPPPHTQILQLCDSGALPQALRLLNSVDDPLRLPSKPLIYAALLQTAAKSRSFSHALQFHSHLVKSGLDSDRFVGNSLLSAYFKLCSDFALTRRVFDNLPIRDVISWTSMVSGYVRAGKPRESLHMLVQMSAIGAAEPNAFTLSAAIKACCDLGEVRLGRCFHGAILGRGFGSNNVIVSTLIDMYGKNNAFDDAQRVFEELPEPDSICWTSIISASSRNDEFQDALSYFHLMVRRKGLLLLADEFTFGPTMTALGNLGRARQGKEAHAVAITSGLGGNVIVESSIVDMYGKCGLVEDSRKVFNRITVKNAVSWCALLGGYCQSGNYLTVLELFREMDKEEDHYSFGTVLRACSGLNAVRQGKEVHCQYLRMGGWKDVIVESALVDLYAKCGFVDYAYSIFSKMSARNLITWNSMICGFAQNGRATQAVRFFDEMIIEGVKPDYISFIGVLFACSHAGFVQQGKEYFNSMEEDYGVTAGPEHYNCIVDLLSRAGLLEEAEDLISKSTCSKHSSLLAALLGSCATYSNPGVAERVAKKMMELEPQNHLSYILLANVYKSVGRWRDALELRKLMSKKGVKKAPGKSWIEVNRVTGNILNTAPLVEYSDDRDAYSEESSVYSL